jgi:hypothetical protein
MRIEKESQKTGRLIRVRQKVDGCQAVIVGFVRLVVSPILVIGDLGVAGTVLIAMMHPNCQQDSLWFMNYST